jgi:hypothetical protein
MSLKKFFFIIKYLKVKFHFILESLLITSLSNLIIYKVLVIPSCSKKKALTLLLKLAEFKIP